MTGGIVINRDAQLLDAGAGLDGPMPGPLMRALAPEMGYTHMRRRAHHERRDPATGEWLPPYAFEPKKLYLVDGRGRLVCGPGFAARIEREAGKLGIPCSRRTVIYPQMQAGRFREDWDRLAANFESRPRQDEAIAAIASSEGGMIIASPGFGKSFLHPALGLLYPEARIVVTTASTAVAETCRSYLSQYLPDVGMVGGGHKSTGRITVYVTASLANVGASVDCDILLGDEAHELAAPTYAEAISMAGRYARRFGFTASPEGRSDGADAVLEGLFGPRIFEMGYQEAESLGLVVPIQVCWVDVVLPVNPAAGYTRSDLRERHGIWQNAGRNDVIAGVARSYEDDDQVLILVDKVVHALHLGAALPDFQMCFNQIEADEQAIWAESGLVDSSRINKTDGERRALREGFSSGAVRKVIATGVWSRGVSFNQLSVLIRADGKSGKIASTQMPGRVSRRHDASDKTCGIVYDFRDQFDAGFKAAAKKREAVYRSHGWGQVRARDWKAVV